jgi:hypothetical protein
MNNMPSNGKCDGLPVNEREREIVLWQRFLCLYPTEKDCLEELYKFIGRRTSECLKCGARDTQRIHKNRISQCRRCNTKNWITADTFFSHIRLPRAWLGAIWLMAQGVKISASRFHQIAGIAYSTAFVIFKKIAMVLSSVMDDTVSLCSSSFLAAFLKRSLKTPANLHPSSEQEQVAPNSVGDAENRRGESTTTEALDKKLQLVYDHLGSSPTDIDSLCEQLNRPIGELIASLTMLELQGLALRLPGSCYVRGSNFGNATTSAQTSDPELLSLVAVVLDFIRSKFHGISRKYLQLYVALHWYYSAQIKCPLGSLLETCSRFRPVTYAEILDYVSPALISLGAQSILAV